MNNHMTPNQYKLAQTAPQRSRRRMLLATTGALSLSACGVGEADAPALAPAPQLNRYAQTNLAASAASYKALFTLPEMVDAWGIAIRPKGAGGHFWVTAGGTSWQFLGDVQAATDVGLRRLSQDGLKAVTIAGADSLSGDDSVGKITGTVFNGADIGSPNFRVTSQVAQSGTRSVRFDGSARFIFVTDSGRVAAWTDRATDGSTVRVDGPTQEVFDGGEQGMALFGVAIKPDTWDRLWLADFGADPQIRTLNASWSLIETQGFINPFASGALRDASAPSKGRAAKPGDLVPFNIHVVGNRVFVAYCVSQPDAQDPSQFYSAEEDALSASAETASGFRPNKGKLVEYTTAGALVRTLEDDSRLNAPWGVAIAPSNFGKLSNHLLVGNFGGNGTIAAYSDATGRFVDFVRDANDRIVQIEGLWALLPGNGESLGDANALYFAAGPNDEKDGLFGALRYLGS